ncbi:hypothetical protein ACFW2Y_26485 [Streptomyces sp. NPDC058877]
MTRSYAEIAATPLDGTPSRDIRDVWEKAFDELSPDAQAAA